MRIHTFYCSFFNPLILIINFFMLIKNMMSQAKELNDLMNAIITKAKEIIGQNWEHIFFYPSFNPFDHFVEKLLVTNNWDTKRAQLLQYLREVFQQQVNTVQLNPQTITLVITDWITNSTLINKMVRTFKKLTSIHIQHRAIGIEGAYLLYRADFKQLTSLYFCNNHIEEKGAKILAKCEWSELKMLQLDKNNLNNKGFYNLLKSNWPNLQYLSLIQNNFTSDMTKMILKHSWFCLGTLVFKQADLSQYTKALLRIVPLLHINKCFNIRIICRSDDSFAVFEHSVTSHCLAKVTQTNTYFVLSHYWIYQDVSFVSPGLMNIKQGNFVDFGN